MAEATVFTATRSPSPKVALRVRGQAPPPPPTRSSVSKSRRLKTRQTRNNKLRISLGASSGPSSESYDTRRRAHGAKATTSESNERNKVRWKALSSAQRASVTLESVFFPPFPLLFMVVVLTYRTFSSQKHEMNE